MGYKDVVGTLQIDKAFLEGHAKTIREKLISAGKVMMQGTQGLESLTDKASLLDRFDMFGINQCLHLASTVLLLGSSSDNLQRTITMIQQSRDFSGQDPTTVVISAVLYYLLLKAEEDPEIETEDKEKIRHIHQRFDELNWMINPRGVQTLGIARLSN
jgi:hypothetical protein